MRVLSVELRDFRTYARAEARARRRPDGCARPQRRRQVEPPRGALLRMHGSFAPHPQRARAGALRCDRRRGSSVRLLDGDRAARADASGSARRRRGAQAVKRMSCDGAPVERLLDVPVRPLDQRLPARPARSAQGRTGGAPRPPRSGRRGALAGPHRDPPRVLTGARSAQRPARPHPRGARSGSARLSTWDASSRSRRSRCAAHRAEAVELLAEPFAAPRRRSWVQRAGRRSSTGRARRADDEEEFVAELQSVCRATLSGVSRARTAPRRARDRCATGASCACMAPRASSGWRCWRCCSPSARCSPRNAAARR